ncbi:MAG: tetratricopeptide repeat protein [Prolixibacteraceae bacterium]
MKTVYLALMAVLLFAWGGYTLAQSPTGAVNASVIYTPAIPSDIETIEEAGNELIRIMQEEKMWLYIYRGSGTKWVNPQSVAIKGSRFEIDTVGGSFIFPYSEYIDLPVLLEDNHGKPYTYPCFVWFRRAIEFRFRPKDITLAQRFTDLFYFMQQELLKEREKEENAFREMAAGYQALKIKPPVSEDQRRLIVQANAMNQQKQYVKAILLYKSVIEMDPVSYPEAYYNQALLYAQIRRLHLAIGSMKRYLTLMPDAKDARAAQDKIYEWEIMLQPQ